MIAALLMTSLVLSSPTAHAQGHANPYLPKALRQIQALQEREALRTLDRALTWAPNTLEDLARAHLYRGLAFAGLAEGDKVLVEFRMALLFHPGLELSADVSPKVAAWWRQAHDRTPPPLPGTTSSPAAPAPSSLPALEPARPPLAPPAPPLLTAAPAPPAPSRSIGGFRRGLGIALGVAAALSVGTALVLGAEAQKNANGAKAAPALSSAESLQRSASSQARTANVLYGCAGGLALGAGVTLVF